MKIVVTAPYFFYFITLDSGSDGFSESAACFSKQKLTLNTSCLMLVTTKGTA